MPRVVTVKFALVIDTTLFNIASNARNYYPLVMVFI